MGGDLDKQESKSVERTNGTGLALGGDRVSKEKKTWELERGQEDDEPAGWSASQPSGWGGGGGGAVLSLWG